MAEVIDSTPSPNPSHAPSNEAPTTSPSPDTTAHKPTPSKRGRRPTCSPSDDLIIVREVSAAKAHIAPFGEVHKPFSTAAARAIQNPSLTTNVTAKRLQNRYKKLIDVFEKREATERVMSGVGGEIGELDDLLGGMLEVQQDVTAAKDAEREAHAVKESRKVAVGEALMEKAVRRTHEEDGDETLGRGSGKRRKVMDEGGDGIDLLAVALKETDMERIAVERERLQLERERMEKEGVDRAEERALLREEREAMEKLELAKFKVMMETFASTQK